MNYAKLEKSARLQRVLAYLKDGLSHSTRDIIREANVCAVNSCISELRANGYDIDCKKSEGIFLYTIVR